MDASVKKVLDDLKARKYKPVYFLQGEEVYYLDLIANWMEANVLQESEKGFNQMVLYGKDVTMATVLTNARRFPMMAEYQLVLVKEAQEIADINKDTGARLLLNYLQQPVPSTVLVFCHMHKTLDKRKELGKNIEKLACTVTAKKPYDNQLPDFASDYAKEKGLLIEGKAIYTLCELVGNSLSRIANEMDKLAITHTSTTPVSAELVLAQVGESREYNIFELQKAIIHKDKLMAARIVNYLEQNTRKNPVIPIVAFLFSFFSKLLIASRLQNKDERSIISALKISSYASRDYSSALRIFSTQAITEAISTLQQADLKLKGVDSSSTSEGQLLRETVFRILA